MTHSIIQNNLRSVADVETGDTNVALVHVDYNAPFTKDGGIEDTMRIESSYETINLLRNKGYKIVLISHFDDEYPEGLTEVAKFMKQSYPELHFINSLDADLAKRALENYPIILLGNIRQDPGEKANDLAFAEKLASLGDIFVNEAFSESHRAYASIVTLPTLLPSYAGLTFLKEIEFLSRAYNPVQPSLFILGGFKYSTKAPLLADMSHVYSNICVGGAIAHPLLIARGTNIGVSDFEEGAVADKRLAEEHELLLPLDVIVAKNGESYVRAIDDIRTDECIVDVGPATLATWGQHINEAATILWNGPVGNYKIGFADGTKKLAEMITESGAFSVVGGGDTVAVLKDLDTLHKFSFVSTAGGAMLDFLAKGTLPGIDALT